MLFGDKFCRRTCVRWQAVFKAAPLSRFRAWRASEVLIWFGCGFSAALSLTRVLLAHWSEPGRRQASLRAPAASTHRLPSPRWEPRQAGGRGPRRGSTNKSYSESEGESSIQCRNIAALQARTFESRSLTACKFPWSRLLEVAKNLAPSAPSQDW